MSEKLKYSIIAIGDSEFITGFSLTGIKTIRTKAHGDRISSISKSEALLEPTPIFEKLLSEQKIGIIITDDKTINSVNEKIRKKIEESVKPVTVILSLDSSSQDRLKEMIKKSLGVDLWKN